MAMLNLSRPRKSTKQIFKQKNCSIETKSSCWLIKSCEILMWLTKSCKLPTLRRNHANSQLFAHEIHEVQLFTSETIWTLSVFRVFSMFFWWIRPIFSIQNAELRSRSRSQDRWRLKRFLPWPVTIYHGNWWGYGSFINGIPSGKLTTFTEVYR